MVDCCFCCLAKRASATRVAVFSRGWSNSIALFANLRALNLLFWWIDQLSPAPAQHCTHTASLLVLSLQQSIRHERRGTRKLTLLFFCCRYVLPIRAGNYDKCKLFSFSSLFKKSFPLSKHIPNNSTCSHKSAANTQGVSGENCHTSEESSLCKIALV